MLKHLTLLLPILLLACSTAQKEEQAPAPTLLSEPPAWAQEVVWYQIFPERFCNGDPGNDPAAADIEGCYPGFVPQGWAVTPWTHDWYAPDPWFGELDGKSDLNGQPLETFNQKVQLRRYGGDLQGVFEKLDYLDSLGITAIYFNPLNDAPSLHKYDPRHWRHIDRNFGPTPRRDARLMAEENPADPATWRMTGADSLFIALIDTLHQRGIRLIMDYSWNHTGRFFWALQDVRKKGEASAYADWYTVHRYDDPATPENEFDYQGWFGIKELPEIRETVEHDPAVVKAYEGELYSPTVREHIFHVTRRWLDPNGDGDPSDGVDGFRLDVAAELPLGFWRDYRRVVREVNPEAYLVGEIWWKEFPDHLLDPEPFLRGDVFDAVMNYRWYRSARHFLARAPEEVPVSEFVDSLRAYAENLRPQNRRVLMNLTASHDVPRVGTSLFNQNKYKYDARPLKHNDYRIHRPDSATGQTLRLLLAQQFSWVGAPHIWAGDEMGMWGADDPDCRKPLIWSEYSFQAETTHPLGRDRPRDEVRFDSTLFRYYQKMIDIRQKHPALRRGELDFLLVDDQRKLLAYRRYDEREEIIALFNTAETAQEVSLPVHSAGKYRDLLQDRPVDRSAPDSISLRLPARQAALLVGRLQVVRRVNTSRSSDE